MSLYVNLFGITIPTYGLMIATGVVLANLIAVWGIRKFGVDANDFIILEAYAFLGGFIGAKVLYIIVSYKEMEWSRITEFDYFNQIMMGGFVFYGGLAGALFLVLLAGKFHKIQSKVYIRKFIFLIPFIHCFGRIGCFFAGCCFGIPYDGFGRVIFPRGSFAPTGIPLFPVQLVEAFALMLIAAIILWLQLKKNWYYTIETYFVIYGIVRFILEYYRYDYARGEFLMFSTSQWISIVLLVVAVVMVSSKKLNLWLHFFPDCDIQ